MGFYKTRSCVTRMILRPPLARRFLPTGRAHALETHKVFPEHLPPSRHPMPFRYHQKSWLRASDRNVGNLMPAARLLSQVDSDADTAAKPFARRLFKAPIRSSVARTFGMTAKPRKQHGDSCHCVRVFRPTRQRAFLHHGNTGVAEH